MPEIIKKKELFKCSYFSIIRDNEDLNNKSKIIPIQFENDENLILKDNLDIFFYDLDKFLWLALKLTEFLKILHSNKIIHTALNSYSICLSIDCDDIKIIDFSRASVLDKTGNIFSNKDFEKPYLAPEQLEMTPYSVDYRTDYYSLGIIFYELLTKNIPYYSKEQILELDFSQNKTIPQSIIYIVKKLLNKYPEDRYQSAEGLLYDLNECKKQLDKKGVIDSFFPGAKDKPTKLIFSDYLYGREKEEAKIRAMYHHINSGNSGFLFVSGYSGIGKTSLVNQTLKPLAEERGFYLYGKYNQFINQPYAATIDGIRSFIKKISDTKKSIDYWRKLLNEVLYPNAQVIIDLVPEAVRILGRQAPLQELDLEKAKNRFHQVFLKCIKTIISQAKPLIFFCDDLQWIDQPSLELLRFLASQKIPNFLIVGSYRDNECNDNPPLLDFLNQLKEKNQSFEQITRSGLFQANICNQMDSIFKEESAQKELTVKKISLEGLCQTDISEQIEDIFKCASKESHNMANIIYKKTMGNPFFIQQILLNLQNEKKIIFNPQKNEWQWVIEDINKLNLADNVGEIMADKIHSLPDETQEILKIAACLGNEFDINDLVFILRSDPVNLSIYLRQAEDKEFIIKTKTKVSINNYFEPENITYKFLHDKIQQTAYELIPKNKRPEIHCMVGQAFLKNYSNEKIEKKLFMIVDHLNTGKSHIKSSFEKERIIEMNILAGKKAKMATAFQAALKYYQTASELLTMKNWDQNHTQMFDIHLAKAELEYICTNFKKAEEQLLELLTRAKTDTQKVDVFKILILLYIQTSAYKMAVEAGLKSLNLSGQRVKYNVNKIDIIVELLKSFYYLRGKRASSFLCSTPINNERINNILNTYIFIAPPAYFCKVDLYVFLILKCFNFLIRYGSSKISAILFSAYGMILIVILSSYKKGYLFGKLSMILCKKTENKAIIGLSNMIFGCFINHWRNHSITSIDYLRKGFINCLDCENHIFYSFSGFCAMASVFCLVYSGLELEKVLNETDFYMSSSKLIRNQEFDAIFTLTKNFIYKISGLIESANNFSPYQFDKEHAETQFKKSEEKILLNWYYTLIITSLYLEGNYNEAYKNIQKAEKVINYSIGFVHYPEHFFYSSLVITKLLSHTNKSKKLTLWRKVKRNQRKMRKWAQNCSANYQHKYLLIEAEIAKIKEKNSKAISLYDQAIKSAENNNFLQNTAIANELAAQFYLSQNDKNKAKFYMLKAINCYEKWGAKVKVLCIKEKCKII